MNRLEKDGLGLRLCELCDGVVGWTLQRNDDHNRRLRKQMLQRILAASSGLRDLGVLLTLLASMAVHMGL
jgi:hypothetical protein